MSSKPHKICTVHMLSELRQWELTIWYIIYIIYGDFARELGARPMQCGSCATVENRKNTKYWGKLTEWCTQNGRLFKFIRLAPLSWTTISATATTKAWPERQQKPRQGPSLHFWCNHPHSSLIHCLVCLKIWKYNIFKIFFRLGKSPFLV